MSATATTSSDSDRRYWMVMAQPKEGGLCILLDTNHGGPPSPYVYARGTRSAVLTHFEKLHPRGTISLHPASAPFFDIQ